MIIFLVLIISYYQFAEDRALALYWSSTPHESVQLHCYVLALEFAMLFMLGILTRSFLNHLVIWHCRSDGKELVWYRPGRRTLSMENMAPHEGSLANSLQEDAKVMVLCWCPLKKISSHFLVWRNARRNWGCEKCTEERETRRGARWGIDACFLSRCSHIQTWIKYAFWMACTKAEYNSYTCVLNWLHVVVSSCIHLP